MEIVDLNGCPIEVTHLEEAIEITARYKEYRHEDKSYSEIDQRQNAYWTDMYNKLMAIRVKLGNN
jgi:hypothetical protein